MPIQPLNDLCPRLLIVSHVTKRGYFSSLAAPLPFEERLGKENSDDAEEDFDVSVAVEREGVLDEADELVEGELRIRLIAAVGGGERTPSTSSSGTLASSAPAISYCSHNSSTSLNERGWRFSRELERASKQ